MITGIILSVISLVYKVSFPGRSVLGRVPATGDFETMTWDWSRHQGAGNPEAHAVPGVIVYRFNSPLVFSNSEAFKDGGEKILIEAASDGGLPTTLVVDCEEMFEVDTTGAAAVTSLLHYARRFNVDLALSRVHSDARQILDSEGLIKELGEDHVYDTVREAVEAVTGEPAHTGRR